MFNECTPLFSLLNKLYMALLQLIRQTNTFILMVFPSGLKIIFKTITNELLLANKGKEKIKSNWKIFFEEYKYEWNTNVYAIPPKIELKYERVTIFETLKHLRRPVYAIVSGNFLRRQHFFGIHLILNYFIKRFTKNGFRLLK